MSSHFLRNFILMNRKKEIFAERRITRPLNVRTLPSIVFSFSLKQTKFLCDVFFWGGQLTLENYWLFFTVDTSQWEFYRYVLTVHRCSVIWIFFSSVFRLPTLISLIAVEKFDHLWTKKNGHNFIKNSLNILNLNFVKFCAFLNFPAKSEFAREIQIDLNKFKLFYILSTWWV